MRPRSLGALLAAASAVTYGCLGVLARLAYGEGWNVPSLLVARFGIAALVVLPLALRERGSWRSFGGALLVGALGYAATTALYFPSLRLMPVALASFLLYLAPPIVAAVSFFALGERLGWRGFVALGLALIGLAMMASGAFTGEVSGVGVLLACGAALAYALTTLGARRVSRGSPWAWTSLGVASGACASYLVFGAATDQLALPPSHAGWVYALLIGTLAGGIALSLFMAALRHLGASQTTVISTLEPVSTLVLAAFVLGEVPSLLGIGGGVLIIAAAALVASL